MKVFYADTFVLPLPEGHRFPMPKYARLRQRVAASGLFGPDEMIAPEPASDAQLLRAHDAGYVRRMTAGEMTDKEMRRIGFPWSVGLVERSRRSVGGTIAACRAVLQDGRKDGGPPAGLAVAADFAGGSAARLAVAANLAGGTHHAYTDHGEGYCVFNDVAVASRVVQDEGLAGRVAILDCDVHQGNGTAAIFAHDPSVYTFSIHGAKNFPFHKEASDLDIALPDGSGDREFLAALRPGVEAALREASAGLAIYIAGADPFEGDRLGRMAVTKRGLAERDRLVLGLCRDWSLPVVIVMGGGYAKIIDDPVESHFQTSCIGREMSV